MEVSLPQISMFVMNAFLQLPWTLAVLIFTTDTSGSTHDNPSRNLFQTLPDDTLMAIARCLGPKSRGSLEQSCKSNAGIVGKMRTYEFPGGVEQIKHEFRDLILSTSVLPQHILNSFHFNAEISDGHFHTVRCIIDCPFVRSRGNAQIQNKRVSYLAFKAHAETLRYRPKMIIFTFVEGVLNGRYHFYGGDLHCQRITESDPEMKVYLLEIQSLIEKKYDIIPISADNTEVVRDNIHAWGKVMVTIRPEIVFVIFGYYFWGICWAIKASIVYFVFLLIYLMV